ncbi:MAG: diacylglycerol kinase family lipid kinase [Lachnospiraceae bacterium]|nr:diacylglycerol kinase family lipid kinase [Lachnospiraceae bacterium]MDD3616533.1 diacylglycerol kinase family lipid kinase [Lachnospiraceae bacterium]
MYYFIINPQSKTGQGIHIWNQVKAALDSSFVTYKFSYTQYRGHARTLARDFSKHMKQGDILTVIGGDGSVNEALNGIALSEQITLGYIPTGSGNDFARGMHIPTDTKAAIDLLLNPVHTQMLDVGVVKQGSHFRKFGVSSGIGFDAGICHKALKSTLKKLLNKLKLGKLTYALLAIQLLIRFKPCPMDIALDDGQNIHFDKVFFATAFTQPFEGGGLMLAPDAKSDDGYFDILIAEGIPKLKILMVLPMAFWGKHVNFHGVHLYKSKRCCITSSEIMPIHMDGESGGRHQQLQCYIEGQLKVITL